MSLRIYSAIFFIQAKKLFLPLFKKKVKNHLVQFWLYNVEVEIKVVRNVILNNFDLSIRLARVHHFLSRKVQSWPKLAIFCNLAEFLQLWRLLEGKRCTLASRSLRSKLFKMAFLTTFIWGSTLYDENLRRWFFECSKNNGKNWFLACKKICPTDTMWQDTPLESSENFLSDGISCHSMRIYSG